MNRNDFLNMINNPAPPDRQQIGEVYDLLEIFPYFQSAHLLLLKGLQNNTDVKFENQLRSSAIHIADREVLYNLLKNEPALPETISVLTPEEPEKKIEELDESPAGFRIAPEEIPEEENRIFYMDPGFTASDPKNDLLELDLDDQYDPNEEAGIDEAGVETIDSAPDKLIQIELIDRFITANPRIEQNRDKKEVPVDDKSIPIFEEGGFVTETLAKIYTSQGYYSKAIDIYEKLSLKFPEKISYFATQIEKVKEHLKN